MLSIPRLDLLVGSASVSLEPASEQELRGEAPIPACAEKRADEPQHYPDLPWRIGWSAAAVVGFTNRYAQPYHLLALACMMIALAGAGLTYWAIDRE